MPVLLRYLLVTSLALLLTAVSFAQQPTSPSSSPSANQPSVKINTGEVWLDVLVKDKKGRPVRDLKPEEIEIFEDNVKQQLTTFRLITTELIKDKESKSHDNAPAKPLSLHQVNLVTLVFDHFDAVRSLPARNAALNFIDNTLNANMLVRVLVAGRQVYVTEHFTNDRKKLHQAIMKATTPSEKGFVAASERVVEQLRAMVAPNSAAAPFDQEMNPEGALAQMTLDTLAQVEKAPHGAKGVATIFALLHVARAQRDLPGRKTVVYFTHGFYLPAGLIDAFQTTISEANRANVSFYAVDVQRVIAGAGNQSSRLESGEVRNETQRGSVAYFNAQRSTFAIFNGIERKMQQGREGSLTMLCEDTGGFVIDDAVDFNSALKRVTTELSSYYALSYTPTKQEYDGKFRAVSVTIARPGVKAQTRSGYFAAPAVQGSPVLAYETPLLAALNGPIVPRDFSFNASLLRFAARAQEVHYAVVLDIPLANLVHAEDILTKVYPVNFAVLGMIKDEKGEIVQRFSESHPLEVPSGQIEELKKESFTLTRHFWLPPGQYTLEAVVHDAAAQRFSAQRQAFTVAAPTTALRASNLFLIKQVEAVEDAAAEADNPLVVQDRRIIPDSTADFAKTAKNDLPFHLSIFPNKEASPPSLKIELLHEGKVVAAANPKLPATDEKGRIAFAAGIPITGLGRGSYRLRATVQQGTETVEEAIAFTINSAQEALGGDPDADAGKIISSSLTPTDAIGELTLSALETAKSIDLSVAELLQEAERNGARMYRLLGEYTYSLRKVRRQLDLKGRIRSEEYQDYEAYPVRGQHALVQLSANGVRFTPERIGLDRKHATEILIKSEEEKGKTSGEAALNAPTSYWAAGMSGFTQRNKFIFITIDPALFFQACEFSAPRLALLNGRETIILNFRPRADAQIESYKRWVSRLEGSIWIDLADKALVRIEGQHIVAQGTPAVASSTPSFVYQQQRLAEKLWSPRLIRINAGGNESLFEGLNWDAWFEFNNFKRFDSRDSDVKLLSPQNKK